MFLRSTKDLQNFTDKYPILSRQLFVEFDKSFFLIATFQMHVQYLQNTRVVDVIMCQYGSGIVFQGF